MFEFAVKFFITELGLCVRKHRGTGIAQSNDIGVQPAGKRDISRCNQKCRLCIDRLQGKATTGCTGHFNQFDAELRRDITSTEFIVLCPDRNGTAQEDSVLVHFLRTSMIFVAASISATSGIVLSIGGRPRRWRFFRSKSSTS